MTDISRLQVQLQVTKLQNKDNPLYQLLHEMIGALKDTSNEVTSLSSSSVDSPVTNNITNNNYAIQSGSGIGNNSSGLSATSMNMVVNNNSVVNNIANNMQLLNGVGSGLGGLHATFIPMFSPVIPSSSSGVTGTGTTGKLPKWASATSLGDSILSESGGNIIALTHATNPSLRLIRGATMESKLELFAGDTYFDFIGTLNIRKYTGFLAMALTDTGTLAWGGGIAILSSSNVALLNAANVFTASQQITGALATHKTSTLVLEQESAGVSKIRAYGADATTAGALTLTGLANDGSPSWEIFASILGLAWGGGAAISSSGNVALKNVSNTFTNGTQVIDSTVNALLVLDRGTTGHFAALALKTAGVDKMFVGLDDDGNNNFAVMNSAGTALLTISPTNATLDVPLNIPVTSYFKGNVAQGYRFNNAADTLNLMILKDDGSLFVQSSVANVLTLDRISGGSGYLRIRRAGVDKFYIGGSSSISGVGGEDSLDIYLTANEPMRLFTNGLQRFGINGAGDWTKGTGATANIMDSVGTPTIASGFGTGPSISGNDYAFAVSAGTGTNTGGQVSFGHTWMTAPICVAANNSGVVVTSTVTTTTYVLLNYPTTVGMYLAVLCRGY